MKTSMDAAAGPLVLARHDLDRDRPDRALDALSKVTGPELETFEFWSLRARALYRLRRWDEALDAAQTGLEREPGDFVLLDVLALAQLERGRRKQARATIEHALKLYPEQAILHAHRALILARMARRSFRIASYKEPRAEVDEALRLDPTSYAVLRVRAQVATLSRDPRASEHAAELLSFDPEDDHAHVIAGSALARRGHVASGLDHYVEAARLDPSDPQMAWIGRRARVLQGRFAAPLLFAQRLTRGRLQLVWPIVAWTTLRLHLLVLTVAVLAFWAYGWAVHIYLRVRTGRRPK
jgi:tetratricopeptide (TPR) repeat protein